MYTVTAEFKNKKHILVKICVFVFSIPCIFILVELRYFCIFLYFSSGRIQSKLSIKKFMK